MRTFGATLGLLVLLQTSPTHALRCQNWDRMDANSKAGTIDTMIVKAIRSNEAQRYRVDHGAVGQCLDGYALRILQDFDSACSDPAAGISAPDKIFKTYIWSCVR